VAANFDPLWVYLYAPMIGALIAFALYRLFPVTSSD
jgi:glycerol uptake facilitator-like aquaporin